MPTEVRVGTCWTIGAATIVLVGPERKDEIALCT